MAKQGSKNTPPTSNDQRCVVKNPNNYQFELDRINRDVQLNTGQSPPKGGSTSVNPPKSEG